MSKQGQLMYRVVSEFLEGKLYRQEEAELLQLLASFFFIGITVARCLLDR